VLTGSSTRPGHHQLQEAAKADLHSLNLEPGGAHRCLSIAVEVATARRASASARSGCGMEQNASVPTTESND